MRHFRIVLGFLLVICVSVVLIGCQNNSDSRLQNDEEKQLSNTLEFVYGLAVETDSFNGTYDEWLEAVRGPKGEDGKAISLQINEGQLQWQYSGDNEWSNLIELSSLVGPSGQDGRQVDFQVSDDYIQWQFVGDSEWTNLLELSLLIGPSGLNGVNGIDGIDGIDGTNGLNGKDGSDGREVDFRVSGGYLQWRYVGERIWKNLFELADLLDDSSGDDEVLLTMSGVENIVYVMGSAYPDLLENVEAFDSEFGDITHLLQVDDSKVNIEEAGEYQISYFVENENGYKKTVSTTFSVILDDNNVSLPNDCFIVKENGYWGVTGPGDEVLIPTEYDDIIYYGSNMLKLYRSDLFYFYDMDDETFIQYDYELQNYFFDGLVLVYNEYEKLGFMNKKGEITIPFIFSDAQDFQDGRAIVSIGLDNYGIIDVDGDYILEPTHDYIYWGINDYLFIEDNDGYTVVDTNFEELIQLSSDFIMPFTNYNGDGVLRVYIDDKIAVVDWDFNLLAFTGDDNCFQISSGLNYGETNGIVSFYNSDNVLMQTDIISYEVANGVIIIEKETGFGVVDLYSGIELIQPIYQEIVQFSDNISLFKVLNSENKWGVMNDAGIITLPFIASYIGDEDENGLSRFATIAPRYYEAESFNNGYAKVKLLDASNGYAVIDMDGSLVGSNTFYSISDFSDGLALVQVSPSSEELTRNYLKEDGTLLFDRPLYYAENFRNGYAIVKAEASDSGFGLIDSEGNYILDMVHDRIGVMSEGLIAVRNESRFWGYYNNQGIQVIDSIYLSAGQFKEGRAVVQTASSGYSIIALDGTTVVEASLNTYASTYAEGFIVFKDYNTGLYGYYNLDGVVVIGARYYEAESFNNGYAKVKLLDSSNGYAIIEMNGNVAGNNTFYSISDFSYGLALVQVSPNGEEVTRNYLKEDGTLLFDTPLYYAENYINGYAIVKAEASNSGFGLIDSEGNYILDMVHDRIDVMSEGRIVVRNESNFWGYYNEQGIQVIDSIYLSAEQFKEGRARVETASSGYSIIALDGTTVVEDSLNTYASTYAEGFIVFKDYNTGLYGYYNLDGEEILGSQYGLISKQGYLTTEQTYSEISDFQENRAIFYDLATDKYGYLDEFGEILTEETFYVANDFNNGYAKVKLSDVSNGYTVIDMDGNFVGFNAFYSISDFSDGLALVQVSPSSEELTRNYLKEDGTLLFDRPLYYAENFRNGYAIVKAEASDSGFGLIDSEGNYILDMVHDRIGVMSEELIAVRNESRFWGYYNEQGIQVIDSIYLNAGQFKEGRARVQTASSGYSIIALDGTTVVEASLNTYASTYTEGFIVFKDYNTGLYGYYNLDGEVAIAPQYLDAESFNDGIAKVTEIGTERVGYLDLDGELVIPFDYDDVADFNDSDYSIVILDDYYGLLDKKGDIVLDIDKEMITKTSNGYFVTIIGKPSVLYVERDSALCIPYEIITGEVYTMYYYDGGWRLGDGVSELIPAYDKIVYNYRQDVWEVYNDDLVGYYDETYTKVLNPMFDDFHVINDTFSVVEVDGNYGVYAIGSIEIVAPFYDYVFYDYPTDYFWVVLGEYVGIYDLNGNLLLTVRYDEINTLDFADRPF